MDSLWFLIPIVAIIIGGLKDMMKIKANQQKLGVSTTDLERHVAELEKRNAALVDRVESLEAIVVSQTWDAVNAPHGSPVERDLRVASAVRHELPASEPAQLNQQRAQQLAQRLGR